MEEWQLILDLLAPFQQDLEIITYPLWPDPQVAGGARGLTYGVPTNLSVPNLLFDGSKFNGSGLELRPEIINLRLLEDPVFRLSYDEARLELSLQSQIAASPMRLMVALVEDEVMLDGIQIPNYVRTMIPNPAGFRIDDISPDRPFFLSVDPSSYDLGEVFFDQLENLSLVAFVQDEQTQEVFQVASFKVGPGFISQLRKGANPSWQDLRLGIYPNPVKDRLRVNLSHLPADEYEWKLLDGLGRTIKGAAWPEGVPEFEISLAEISGGLYQFCLYQAGQRLVQKKVWKE